MGGDLDGITEMPAGFSGVQDYGKLANRLLERGLDEKTLEQIFWSNALGVIDKCSM
jgi:microsomal dipeptidase-like Zn-dependent dipeptidase